ncbi:MAG: aldehyde dehydrogenase family protein [Myxococcota bacterium]
MTTTHRNLIGGKEVAARSGATFENRSPFDPTDVIGLYPRSGADDVDAAVATAREGFAAWRRVPAPARGEILGRAGELLRARKEEIARLMAREMGKTLVEARGDVQEAVDTALYAQGEGRRLFGRTTHSELPDKAAFTLRRPLGVCGLISPWNFPVAIPSWKSLPALLCGNAVVLKPPREAPGCAEAFVRVLLDAGVEPRAVSLLHGSGEEAGRALVEHPGVAAISFTGSTEVGRGIAETCGRTLKRLSLEMGGKNAVLVAPDADLELALDGVLWGAFGTSGQRCTATSRLLLPDALHDSFVERLVARAGKLRLGDPLDEKTDVGPLVSAAQLERVAGWVKIAIDEGARVRCGGKRAEGLPGHFYAPTVLCDVRPEMRIAREEVFGPVLAVLRYRDLDEAFAWANAVDYGLSSSLYTNDVRLAFRAADELEAGITYVNAPTIGAECHLPFGGVKQTGNGHREGGWGAYEFFSEVKTVYVDYSGRLQRAQIDNR